MLAAAECHLKRTLRAHVVCPLRSKEPMAGHSSPLLLKCEQGGCRGSHDRLLGHGLFRSSSEPEVPAFMGEIASNTFLYEEANLAEI